MDYRAVRSAAGGVPAVDAPPPPRPRMTGSHRQARIRPPVIGLVPILAVQAALSLRLIWSGTASQDEAAPLWAGHLLWSHWLHGTPVPPFQAYFPGAPVVYPPVGAVADSIGGLAGARVLSLLFMLGATALLWSTAGRLFDHRAAFFAAALFAACGPVIQMGAYATYDAMSLCCVALATWCAVRAGPREDATGWMIAAGAALALANATAYWSAVFDPVVLGVTLLSAYPRPGGKPAFARTATLLTVLATLLMVGTLTGGGYYVTGIDQALSAGAGGTNSALSVLDQSGSWLGVIAGAALCGVTIAWFLRLGRARTWLVTLLAAAALIGPAEQASLRTAFSLSVHVVSGAWFAAIAAGYAASALIDAVVAGWTRAVIAAAAVIALAVPVTFGAGQSRAIAARWPDASSFIAIFRPLADRGSGRLLVEDPHVAEYYLAAGKQWQRWSTTRNIVLPTGLSMDIPDGTASTLAAGTDGFARYISEGYFSLIALDFADTTAMDHRIEADVRANHHYHVIAVVPYGPGPYVVWQYQPGEQVQRYEPNLSAARPAAQQRTRR